MPTADRGDLSTGDRTSDGGESLEALLQLVALGQAAPFRRLYDRTSAGVLRAATTIVRDRSSAENVTRDVFVDVWQLAGSFDPAVGSAVEWMMLLTRSQSIECLRRRRTVRQRGEQQTATEMTTARAAGLLNNAIHQGAEFLTSIRPVTVVLPFPRLVATE